MPSICAHLPGRFEDVNSVIEPDPSRLHSTVRIHVIPLAVHLYPTGRALPGAVCIIILPVIKLPSVSLQPSLIVKEVQHIADHGRAGAECGIFKVHIICVVSFVIPPIDLRAVFGEEVISALDHLPAGGANSVFVREISVCAYGFPAILKKRSVLTKAVNDAVNRSRAHSHPPIRSIVIGALVRCVPACVHQPCLRVKIVPPSIDHEVPGQHFSRRRICIAFSAVYVSETVLFPSLFIVVISLPVYLYEPGLKPSDLVKQIGLAVHPALAGGNRAGVRIYIIQCTVNRVPAAALQYTIAVAEVSFAAVYRGTCPHGSGVVGEDVFFAADRLYAEHQLIVIAKIVPVPVDQSPAFFGLPALVVEVMDRRAD